MVSTTSFTESDMQYMKSLFLTYQFHVRLGILKYYLYYLQGEHGIAAIELLRKWLDAVLARDERMPLSCRLHSEVLRAESRSGDWALLSWQDEANFFFQDIDNYYREFHRFAQQAYNFKSEEAVFDVLLEAQAATMPRLGRDYPHEVQLAHDITSYFRQYKQVANVNRLAGTLRSLDQFKPACLEITAGSWQLSSLSFHKLEIDGHADAWELPSALRFY